MPRSTKASIVAIMKDVVSQDPETIRRCIEDGLKARPPKSYAYLQLAAAYLDGQPEQRIKVDGSMELVQVFQQAHASLAAKLAGLPVIDITPQLAALSTGGGNGSH